MSLKKENMNALFSSQVRKRINSPALFSSQVRKRINSPALFSSQVRKKELPKTKNNEKSVGQEQIHDIIFSREIGWQEIIYDLINTEQIDPWDINITFLTDRYLEKIKSLEEADFFISGKVLLAASLLLRIKSEILLNKYLKSIDEILFGKKEQVLKYVPEKIEFDETLPELVLKTPIPRFKRVTLQELMASLNKAIVTENRRIKKEIFRKNPLRDETFLIPRKKINIKNKIREIYMNLLSHLKETERKKISFSEFIGEKREEKIISFSPLLHLEHQKKIWLEQEIPFSDFHIWLNQTYMEHHKEIFSELKEEIEKTMEEMDDEKKERLEKANKEFENPLEGM